MSANSRIATFDVVKAMVMLLVVGGHLGALVENADLWGNTVITNASIGVAMPIFFVMSGYFSRLSIQNGSIGKIVARIVGLIWPLASFGVVFGIIAGVTEAKPLWKVLLYPFSQVFFGGWFLRTLAIIYLFCVV